MAPKKPAFPNRPCPKCQKPIHIKSKKHEECGWSMEGSAEAPPKPGINKADAVRAILDKNPKTPVTEVVSTLATQGIKVSGNYVYMLKSKARARRKRAKRQKAMVVSTSTAIANPLDLIRDVKQLAERAGGLGKLKLLVDVLAE